MKKLWALALIFLVFFSILPYLAGVVAHARYVQALDVISDMTGFEIQSTKYERGWLTSLAETEITIPPKSVLNLYSRHVSKRHDIDYKVVKIKLQHKLYHGPIVFDDAKAAVEKKWLFSQAVVYSKVEFVDNDLVQKNHVLRARTEIHMNGGGTTVAESTAFTFKDKDSGDSISWGGLKSRWDFGPNFVTIKGSIKAPNFTLVQKNELLRLQKLRILMDREKTSKHLWLGSMRFAMESLEIDDPDHDSILVQDIDLLLTDKYQDRKVDLLTSTADLVLEKLSVGNKNFGPGKAVANLRNLDVKAFEKTRKILRGKEIKEDKTDKPLTAVDKIFQLLPAFLKQRPELAIRIDNLKVPEGYVDGNLRLAIGSEKHTEIVAPFYLLNSMFAKFDITMPARTLRKLITSRVEKQIAIEHASDPLSRGEFLLKVRAEVEDVISSLEQQNLLLPKGDEYELVATFRNNELQVNNKKVKIPLFQ